MHLNSVSNTNAFGSYGYEQTLYQSNKMKSKIINPYCGAPGVIFRDILKLRATSRCIESWFGGAPLYFTHKGRIAIRKACQLIDIRPGDEILMPAYNCGSEIDPFLKGGASIILYRVDKCGIIDIHDMQCRITKKTKAVYATHYFGFPQKIEQIKEICEKRHLFLIEDCALSLFSQRDSVKLGTTGDIAIFSLTKSLPVPDGGVLVVNNVALMKQQWNMTHPKHVIIFKALLPLIKSRMMKQLSASKKTKILYYIIFHILALAKVSSQKQIDIYAGPGPEMLPNMYYNDEYSNWHLSAISNRILRSFNADYIYAKRRENYILMLSLLKVGGPFQPLFNQLPPGVCPLHFPVLVNNRDKIVTKLNKMGINSHYWWKGYHRELPWKDFPESCYLKNNLLTLPIHQDLSQGEIQYVAHMFMNLVSKNN